MHDTGLFISHLGLGDIILLLPAIANCASNCKLLYIFCKNIYTDTIIPFLLPYNNIKIVELDSQLNDQDMINTINQTIQYLIDKHIHIYIYSSGYYNKNYNIFTDFPNHFYKDLSLDFNYTLNSYTIPITQNAIMLHALLKDLHNPYIFLHTQASNLNLNIDIDTTNTNVIIINPEINMYTSEHIYYNIAQKFLRKENNHTLLDYKLVIENANELHLIDSSYFCFAALCRPVIPIRKIVYSRYQQPFKTLLNNTWTQYYCSTIPSSERDTRADAGIGGTIPSSERDTRADAGIGGTIPSSERDTRADAGIGGTIPSSERDTRASIYTSGTGSIQ
jgi:hypothetical protein